MRLLTVIWNSIKIKMPAILYIIATPIGNFGDITFRALEALKSVDLILSEDTRVARKLLNHFGVQKPLQSYHQHSGASKTEHIINLLHEGKIIALISDAGTPGISDPGAQIVASAALGKNVKIIPIPGPSAVIAALSVCGFPSDKFIFLGFPPAKNKRKKYFQELLSYPYTAVFYESGFRILKTLSEINQLNDNKLRQIVVCRELTKIFETIYRGTVSEVIEQIKKDTQKGEFTTVIEGNKNV